MASATLLQVSSEPETPASADRVSRLPDGRYQPRIVSRRARGRGQASRRGGAAGGLGLVRSGNRLRRLENDTVHDARARRRDVVPGVGFDDVGVCPGGHEDLGLGRDRMVLERDDFPLRDRGRRVHGGGIVQRGCRDRPLGDRRDRDLGWGQAAGVDLAEVSRVDVDVGSARLGALDEVAACQFRPGELVGQVCRGFHPRPGCRRRRRPVL